MTGQAGRGASGAGAAGVGGGGAAAGASAAGHDGDAGVATGTAGAVGTAGAAGVTAEAGSVDATTTETGGAAGSRADGGADAGAAGSAGASGGASGKICGFTMPNPASSGLANQAAYDTSAAGVVTDKVSGLMWDRGLATTPLAQADALAHCAASRVGDYQDWRLPTVLELWSLWDPSVASPSPQIDLVAFPSTPAARFWTSSHVVGTPASGAGAAAWTLDFQQGGKSVELVTVARDVRCARTSVTTPARCYSPGARYRFSNGRVIDAATGLDWEQNTFVDPLSWSLATSYCQNLGGLRRLPTIKELETIVDDAQPAPPLIDPMFMDATGEFYWSSSIVPSTTNVWTFSFGQNTQGTAPGTVALHWTRCVHVTTP